MIEAQYDFTRVIDRMVESVKTNSSISPSLYDKYNVKRGLRNANGTVVLVGITRVAAVEGYQVVDGKKIPQEGQLFYRGIPLTDLVNGFQADKRMGYEEVVYLLLFGKLPTKDELKVFNDLLDSFRQFPPFFTEDVFFKSPSANVMNKLQRVVLTLYSHDEKAEDTSLLNVVTQTISLIAKMPMMMAYAYQAKKHYFDLQSLVIHRPKKGVGAAENILHMSRSNSYYTPLEAELLDLCLVVHAEHGGGNNSSFATHVVSSTGTDTYSAISTAIGSLKGPKHGGANNMVAMMIKDIKENVKDWTNEDQLRDYLIRILNKEVFNKKGLVYGMGHAVYTLSDPRAILLKDKASELAEIKGYEKQFQLLCNIENITRELFYERKGPEAHISANVDLYSGLVYEMLNISEELYTPIFAVARTAGWCAHRLEQIQDEKIMRPAYVTLGCDNVYVPLSER